MSDTRRMFVTFVQVSRQMAADAPDLVEAETAKMQAAQTEARGPRGGRYRLGVPVATGTDTDTGFMYGTVAYWARREGTYIRPGRK
jgi:hypothetical protein